MSADAVPADELLAAYDRQLRRSQHPPAPGWVVEQAGPVLRLISPSGASWGSTVLASDLDADSADDAIADQVAFFAGLGQPFEWKWHGYDRPVDLPARLAAAGFEPDEPESVVAGLVDDVVRATDGVRVPPEVTLRHLSEEDPDRDYARIGELKTAVWGGDPGPLMDGIRAERDAAPESLLIHVAEAGDQIVCAAWVRFHAGTDFASLWGGSTLPAWRRKGIYRALVERRAREAEARGFRYLQVDASSDSLPILGRLGLRKLTDTRPFNWSP